MLEGKPGASQEAAQVQSDVTCFAQTAWSAYNSPEVQIGLLLIPDVDEVDAAGFGTAEALVLVDSNLVPALARDLTLGGRIAEGEKIVVSYVTGPELRNAVAKGRGLRGVPRIVATLAVLKSRPSIDTVIMLRGRLVKVEGKFGDAISGAQALEAGIPLITSDKELSRLISSLGSTVR